MAGENTPVRAGFSNRYHCPTDWTLRPSRGQSRHQDWLLLLFSMGGHSSAQTKRSCPRLFPAQGKRSAHPALSPDDNHAAQAVRQNYRQPPSWNQTAWPDTFPPGPHAVRVCKPRHSNWCRKKQTHQTAPSIPVTSMQWFWRFLPRRCNPNRSDLAQDHIETARQDKSTRPKRPRGADWRHQNLLPTKYSMQNKIPAKNRINNCF